MRAWMLALVSVWMVATGWASGQSTQGAEPGLRLERVAPGRLGAEVASVRGPGTFTVLRLESPAVEGSWVVRGEGHLSGGAKSLPVTLWNEVGGVRYFSRGEIRASREQGGGVVGFFLPFTASPGDRPARLELEVALPEGVELSLSSVYLDAGIDPALAERVSGGGAWFSSRLGGLLGGIMGAAMGLLGAFVGVARSRGAVRAARAGLGLMLAAGGVMLVGGMTAWVLKQPYHVYFPLMLCGVIGATIPATLLAAMRGDAVAVEQRRMRAADV